MRWGLAQALIPAFSLRMQLFFLSGGFQVLPGWIVGKKEKRKTGSSEE